MQIMPTGGSWVNPAALNQQAIQESKHNGSTGNKSTLTDAVDKLQHSEKTGDRDANERYDGPQEQHSSSNSMPTPEQDPSMLSLPALDDLPVSTLDLLG